MNSLKNNLILFSDFDKSREKSLFCLVPARRILVFTILLFLFSVTQISANQIFTLPVIVNPMITCPGNQTRNTDTGTCTYKVVGTEFNPTAYIGSSATSKITNNYNNSNTLTGAIFSKGTTTIIWTITDASGNSATCSFDVIIKDHENPTIKCMVNKTRNTHKGLCTYTTVGSEFDPPGFSDNCAGSTITNNYNNSNTLTGAIFSKGTTTVIWTVTDASGNSASCNFDVTVQGLVNPTINCVANQTRNTNVGVCTYMVVGNEFDPTAFTDSCPGTIIVNNYNNSKTLVSAVFPKGITTVTWTVTEADGSAATCSFNVNIEDHENPSIKCSGNKIVNCDLNQCTSAHFGTTWDASGIDNCPGSGIYYILTGTTTGTGSSLNGTIFNIGLTTVTWTITDASTNKATCSYSVTVNDIQNPTIIPPVDVKINTDMGTCIATGVALGTPVAADNCGIRLVTNNAPSSFPLGTTVVTWIVTDIHSNTSKASQNIIVSDNENPTITAPVDITVNVDAGLCGSSGKMLGTPVTNDNCGVASISYAPLNFNVGNNIVTWTVTDIHGNINTAIQHVIVIDNQKPTITAPKDITVYADMGSCLATGVALGTPLVADNCGVQSYTNDAPLHFNVGINIVTWTVTDIHGNINTAIQQVIVIDNQKPTITASKDITVYTDVGLHVATGIVLGTPVTADNCGVESYINDAPASFPAGVNKVTWTLTDIHGNTNTATQIVTVIDNLPPTITSPTVASIFENTTSVITITATDPNIGDNLKFSISGGVDSSKFNINAVSGELNFKTAPNFEIPTDADLNNIYEVDVRATDGGGASDTKTISVTVKSVSTDIILFNYRASKHQADVTLNTYPVPSAGETFVDFTSPEKTDATVTVYNVNGSVVANLFSNVAEADQLYKLTFNETRSLPAGFYICVLKINTKTIMNKIMIK